MNFTDRLPQMITLLRELVEIESPSHDKSAVDHMADRLSIECRRLGARVELVSEKQTGNQVIARWTPARAIDSKAQPILLLSHMDTVFPLGTLTKMPFIEGDGKIFGPGVADMKGGIVVALTALAVLRENGGPNRPIAALFTSDEEIGSRASRPLIEELARQACLVLVLEPGLPDGAVKTWRKGVGEFTVRTRGRAAHAGGDHEKGRNAIEEMAHQVLAIQRLTDYERGTTLNVGVIHGGTASNVVPDEAVAEVDLRVMQPGEAERISAALQALRPILKGTTVEVSGELNRPPMPFDDRMKTTFEKVRAIAAAIGLDLKAGGTGGGSDANFIAPLGIPVLDGLGPAGEGYHSEREYIFANSLLERAQLVTAILENWE
jgi:glutamate carboxypeptidase